MLTRPDEEMEMAFIPMILTAALLAVGTPAKKDAGPRFQSAFTVDKADLATTGRNPYFIPLEPGAYVVLESPTEHLTFTVLDETKLVDGVETRVVEERELRNGKLAEVSRNYYAISRSTKDVYYFGEDVDMYGPKGVTHGGTWHSGKKAKFGLMMPGKPKLRDRHYQEQAPGVAMDKAEVVGMDETVQTPAGTYRHCLKVAERADTEPGVVEHKYYAPGVGMVRYEALRLVDSGRKTARK